MIRRNGFVKGIVVGHLSDPIYSGIDVLYNKSIGFYVRRGCDEIDVLDSDDDFLRISERPSYMTKKESSWMTRDNELANRVYRATLRYMDYPETPGVQIVVRNVVGRDGRVYDMYRTFVREEYDNDFSFEYIKVFYKLAKKEDN